MVFVSIWYPQFSSYNMSHISPTFGSFSFYIVRESIPKNKTFCLWKRFAYAMKIKHVLNFSNPVQLFEKTKIKQKSVNNHQCFTFVFSNNRTEFELFKMSHFKCVLFSFLHVSFTINMLYLHTLPLFRGRRLFGTLIMNIRKV